MSFYPVSISGVNRGEVTLFGRKYGGSDPFLGVNRGEATPFVSIGVVNRGEASPFWSIFA